VCGPVTQISLSTHMGSCCVVEIFCVVKILCVVLEGNSASPSFKACMIVERECV